MTKLEHDTIRRTINTLQRMLPDDEPRMIPSSSRKASLIRFTTKYLAATSSGDLSCYELWAFYSEVAAAGRVPPMPKTLFFRELPAALEAAFGLKKSHNVKRNGKPVRGFQGIEILEVDLDTAPPAASKPLR
jgi:hypothetical protein